MAHGPRGNKQNICGGNGFSPPHPVWSDNLACGKIDYRNVKRPERKCSQLKAMYRTLITALGLLMFEVPVEKKHSFQNIEPE